MPKSRAKTEPAVSATVKIPGNLTLASPMLNRSIQATAVLAFFVCANICFAQENVWRSWRGPSGKGIAENQTPVTTWSETENVLWKIAIPGRGHSSPIVHENLIFLTTSDVKAQTQSVICVDRDKHEIAWQKVVNEGNFNPKIYPTNTHASPTMACDGKRVYAMFNNNNQNQVTALDLEGNILWQTYVAKYVTQYPFGSGSSPILHNGLLYVPNEANRECAIIVLNPENGEEVKRIERGAFSSYSTPVVANVAGKDQLLISGGSRVSSYDPESGKELWKVPTKWQVSCGTMVWEDNMVYASGGFPAQQTLAINADSGELVWQNGVKFYEQSMLVHDGRLYGLSESGVVFCWDAKTGSEHFKQRFQKGESASPVLAGGNIYFTAQNGATLVIKAGTDKYEEVARNNLGNVAYASFALVDNLIYTRVGKRKGKNNVSEFLYCLGSE